jgi:hypothetical protein
MYITDFGLRSPPTELDIDKIRACIDAALAWLMISDDMDLLIELIMVAVFLRVPWSPYLRISLKFVLDTWDRLGFLPGPSLDTAKLRELTTNGSPEKVTEYIFCNIYHTMYVAGLLCSSLLFVPPIDNSAAWAPPKTGTRNFAAQCCEAIARAERFSGRKVQVAASTVSCDSALQAASVARLSGLLDKLEPTRTAWRSALRDLDMMPNDVALVLADAVIIYAARHYDLSRLLVGLDEALMLPSAISPTVVAGVGFLLHQQLSDGAIGAHMVVAENRRSPAGAAVTRAAAERFAAYLARLTADSHIGGINACSV